ncbi:hypothetical protein EVAR_79705_1 [Eumeta japonica]|uniref:Uncharacterized protein n=1 Tax=Eumeta variegata TaxID=151549 RepID=A0A4C1TC60_EUMVA|nr:hypothetical protein EVAR_79705_1 [Eumeta japonica]
MVTVTVSTRIETRDDRFAARASSRWVGVTSRPECARAARAAPRVQGPSAPPFSEGIDRSNKKIRMPSDLKTLRCDVTSQIRGRYRVIRGGRAAPAPAPLALPAR